MHLRTRSKNCKDVFATALKMLATQLRAGGFPQQTFIAQQPQVATWQTAPVPLPNVQENSFSTSARIEEVSPVSSGRASRSGSHSTFQQNDSSSYYRSRLYPQSAAPQNAGVPYDQSVNYGNVPVQSTTYTPHNFYTGQPPRQQSYYPPPPPSRPAYQPLPRQEPLHPVASASSPTSSRPVSVNNLPLPQPGPEPDQPTAQRTFVDQFTDFLQKHPFDVQLRVLTQIREYVSGKPTPNPQIRTWGDRLKSGVQIQAKF
ncbi:hypothetical protein BJ322DRAFT_307091 [Thelephora terrestris]|uniref:Uncharacterized protein n=1 Tax=Thelephora terrestris TaxID=56493 RepID=A0A9P6H630_9AGAM|nr:hypothetical protein BJ322DRAFT_307091 [Thelephora terrestris]